MNGADVIVAIAVGIMVLLAAAMIWRNRRNGKRSCGCQCSDCGYGCGKSMPASEKRFVKRYHQQPFSPSKIIK